MSFKEMQKMKGAPDLSDADSYIVIYTEGESVSLGINGNAEQLFQATYNVLSQHEHLKSMFEAVIVALDDPEIGVHEPIPPEEIN